MTDPLPTAEQPRPTPLSAEALRQVESMLGGTYPTDNPNVRLLLGTARKLLATLNDVLHDVEEADERINMRGDFIAGHLFLDGILKRTGRRDG